MKTWLVQHWEAAGNAWRRLVATPVNSLLSLLAIGIALALPAGGQMLLANAMQLVGTASALPQISVFMTTDADRAAVASIGARLERLDGVGQVVFLSRESTLTRMKSNPGLRDVIEALPGNPFPDAFVVGVTDERPKTIEALAAEFRQWPKVEHVQLDSAWVRRLDALLRLGRNAVVLLAALLGTGLVAISFSIIRMQVLTHRNEVEVSRLLGATDAFIRRPYQYFGVLLGLGGGMMAWTLVGTAALWLKGPLGELAGLYDVTLVLRTLDRNDSAALLLGACALGWLGATISLRQHLEEQ